MELKEKSSIIENLLLVHIPLITVYPTKALLASELKLVIGFHKS